jgi:hypothetical protein
MGTNLNKQVQYEACKNRKGPKRQSKGQVKLTMGVSHCGLAIYIKKYLKAKEKLWKLKYFTMQKHNRQKIL